MQCNCASYSVGTMGLFPKGKVSGWVINIRISADVPVLPLYPSWHAVTTLPLCFHYTNPYHDRIVHSLQQL
jgi:hypothetical protein